MEYLLPPFFLKINYVYFSINDISQRYTHDKMTPESLKKCLLRLPLDSYSNIMP